MHPDTTDPGDFQADPIGLAAEFARTAPSPRNIQPWAFERTQDSIRIYLDRSRSRPVADPHGREMFISCGALVRFACLALEALGAQYSLQQYPDDQDPDLLAMITLLDGHAEPNQTARELVTVAMKRRTNWNGYRSDPVSNAALAELVKASTGGPAQVTAVADSDRADVEYLIAAANHRQLANPKFIAELHRWPTGRPEVSAADGDEPVTTEHLTSTRLLAISTPGDTENSWLAAGQLLADILLKATWLGLSITFANQPIQLPSSRTELTERLHLSTDIQQLVRLSYANVTADRTPRRRLDELTAALPEHW